MVKKASNEIESSQFMDWLDKPDLWIRSTFEHQVSEYFMRINGIIEIPDRTLIAVLCTQIELYVECVIQIRKTGLINTYNSGSTIGPNPHIPIADKALNRILHILRDLKMTQKTKDSTHFQDGKNYVELLAGPK